MEEKEKKTIYASLQKCEQIVQDNLKTIGEPHEAELRSINNEKLAVELLTFGTYVADVAHMAQTEKDHVDQLFEQMKQDKKDMPVNKAESEVKTDLSYIAALQGLRDIQKSAEVLKRKERSLNAILDQSRSRLSLVSKSLPT